MWSCRAASLVLAVALGACGALWFVNLDTNSIMLEQDPESVQTKPCVATWRVLFESGGCVTVNTTVRRPLFPNQSWMHFKKDGENSVCVEVPCWVPATDVADCDRRCKCGWSELDYETKCACAMTDIPACQGYFPRPNIEWLERLSRQNPGLTPSDRIVVLGDSLTWCAPAAAFC